MYLCNVFKITLSSRNHIHLCNITPAQCPLPAHCSFHLALEITKQHQDCKSNYSSYPDVIFQSFQEIFFLAVLIPWHCLQLSCWQGAYISSLLIQLMELNWTRLERIWQTSQQQKKQSLFQDENLFDVLLCNSFTLLGSHVTWMLISHWLVSLLGQSRDSNINGLALGSLYC